MNVYKRGYEKHVGIGRDVIYPHMAHFKKESEKNKKAFEKYINDLINSNLENKIENGFFENCRQRFIPVSYLLGNYSFASEKVKQMIDYANEVKRNCSNSVESVFIGRYLDGLFDYVFDDLGNVIRKEEAYFKIIKDLKVYIKPNFKSSKDFFDVINYYTYCAITNNHGTVSKPYSSC